MVSVNDDPLCEGMAPFNCGNPDCPAHRCWICGDPNDHDGKAHSEATGDGLTRYDIVALMNQGGYTWRDSD